VIWGSGCRQWVAVLACLATAFASGCGAPKGIALPGGPGTPAPDAAAAYQEAVLDCHGVRTLTVTLGLSGRVGATRLRGNVDAGFDGPDKIRLEMRPPIGRPIFILVAPGANATLYLTRENRVLRNAPTPAVVEALVGLRLDGAELRALVSGCGFGVAEPSGGRSFDGQWIAVTTGSATTYLRQSEGRWRIFAATREGLTVLYSEFSSGRASALQLEAPVSKANLTARLSDMNINLPLEPSVFEVNVPAAAEPLTLEELRRAGPLGQQ
jgi:outer membrane lipoprotein-sorting protein